MSLRPTPDSVGRFCFPRHTPRNIGRLLLLSVASGLLVLVPSPGQAQSSSGNDDMEFRVGVTAGGIGLVGLSFEFRWGDRSIDTNLATFGFKDVSLAVTGKQ